jgi:ASC-1-like (ASCH) protein
VGGSILFNKSTYESEFANYLSYDTFKKNVKQMSIDYLRYMLMIYSNAITKSKKWFYCEDKMFINIIKAFILKIGISSKKVYEKIYQSLLNTSEKGKDNICSFEKFLKGFSQILKLKEENTIFKYRFLLSLFRLGEEDINVKHINIFMQLLKGEIVFEIDFWDDLNKNLVQRYDRIYPNDTSNNFRYDKILICLETFFDKYNKH